MTAKKTVLPIVSLSTAVIEKICLELYYRKKALWFVICELFYKLLLDKLQIIIGNIY